MPFMFNDDPQAAFELYRKIFGAREVHRVTQPNGKPSHIQMAIGETHVMLDDATAPHAAEYRAKGFAGTPRDFGGTPLHLYIYVADADAAFKRALDSGCEGRSIRWPTSSGAIDAEECRIRSATSGTSRRRSRARRTDDAEDDHGRQSGSRRMAYCNAAPVRAATRRSWWTF